MLIRLLASYSLGLVDRLRLVLAAYQDLQHPKMIRLSGQFDLLLSPCLDHLLMALIFYPELECNLQLGLEEPRR